MKRFLSAGEGYALFPTNINYRMPRYFPAWRAPLLFVFSFFMCLRAGAMEPNPVPMDRAVLVADSPIDVNLKLPETAKQEIRRVSARHRVPEEFWSTAHVFHINGDTIRKTLEEYRGKPLLIDFWATWCKSCIEGFPHLESIQQEFGTQLNVLLVNTVQTRDTHERAAVMFARYKELHDYAPSLPYILLDSIFLGYFPHQRLPHMVWINSDGFLMANSYSTDVTKSNVEAFIGHGTVALHQKDDFMAPWIDRAWVVMDNMRIVSGSFFCGYAEGSRSRFGPLEYPQDASSQFYFTNHTHMRLFQRIYAGLRKGIPPTSWIFDSEIDRIQRHAFFFPDPINDAYSYVLRFPYKVSMEDVIQHIQRDMEDQFRMRPIYKNELTRIMVIRPGNRVEQLKSKGSIPQAFLKRTDGLFRFDNVPMHFYLSRMGWLFDVPVVLEEVPADYIDAVLPKDILDYSEKALVSLLEEQGFEVSEVYREHEFIQFQRL